MTKEGLLEQLQSKKLQKHIDEIEPHLKNSIGFTLKRMTDDQIGKGQSKIGGNPDLPEMFSWPVAENTYKKRTSVFSKPMEEIVSKSLSFIAQINLEEVTMFDGENLLPTNGILYFFYSADQEAWGFDIKDKDQFKVYFFNGDIDELRKVEYPSDLPDYAKFSACKLNGKKNVSLPNDSNEIYKRFSHQEMEIIIDIESTCNGNNKLLGYPYVIQDEMELECELVTNGLYCGDQTGYKDFRANILKPNAKNWQLLFQVDSNDECGMNWGDGGMLYYWIRKQDSY